jgi:molybdenum cofactor cytidylyltransferase
MRALTVELREAEGRVLCCTIFRAGGKRLFARGRMLSAEDVQLLEGEGLAQVWVTELEEGETGEDEAAFIVAQAIGCGSVEMRPAAGGRANLIAQEDCCILVDDDLLKQINCTANLVIATRSNFSFAGAGQRIATVKSAPFAMSRSELDTIESMLKERGPILQARPANHRSLAVLYTDPIAGERSREPFESILRQRLEKFGARQAWAQSCVEEESLVARSIRRLLQAKPAAIIVASTSAPAGPCDVVGRAMQAAGCSLERFLAPVEPGNLLLLGYSDDIPVISAPGCFRSPKPNVLDLLLPPVMSRYRVSAWEIACLGHGGLIC